MRRMTFLLLPLAAGLGCERGPSPEMQAQLTEISALSAEKDSLLRQVAASARLMSEISAELVTVADQERLARVAGEAESPVAATQDSLRVMVADVTARIETLEERLAASQRRVRGLQQTSDSARAELTQALTDLQTTIENQKTTIAFLSGRVETLETENVQLATEKAALADTVEQLEVVQFTAYYIVGTKDELIEKGIVTEEGGSRVLFIFGRTGKTLVPARELDTAQFTPIDLRTTLEIALPDTLASYRIASRQNVAFLADAPDKDGKVRSPLRITSPDEFWLPSKFLIVVRS
jgi:chaperonin cofactor prefoldin